MKHDGDNPGLPQRGLTVPEFYVRASERGKEREYCAPWVNDLGNFDLYERQLQRQWTPEQRLMVAVLEDAMDCLRQPEGLERTRAEVWVDSAADGGLYSFESICSHLGLDAKACRAVIRELVPVARRGQMHAVPDGEAA